MPTYDNVLAATTQIVIADNGPNNIPYDTISLVDGINHQYQLEVERIFTNDLNGYTSGAQVIKNFLANSVVNIEIKRKLFIIPPSYITYNDVTKTLTIANLTTNTYTYVASGGGYSYSIPVPPILNGDKITIRRKTISNIPLVSWTAGTKLTSNQLNLMTTQLLYLQQEVLDRVFYQAVLSGDSVTALNNNSVNEEKLTINSVSTSKIQALAVTNDKIALGGITYDRINTTTSPWAVTLGDNQNITGDKTFTCNLILGNNINKTVKITSPLSYLPAGDVAPSAGLVLTATGPLGVVTWKALDFADQAVVTTFNGVSGAIVKEIPTAASILESIPTASSTDRGLVQVASGTGGLRMVGNILSIDPAQASTLPMASASVLGGIKLGSGLTINTTSGVVSVDGWTPGSTSVNSFAGANGTTRTGAVTAAAGDYTATPAAGTPYVTNAVDTITAQNITGIKTFKANQIITSDTSPDVGANGKSGIKLDATGQINAQRATSSDYIFRGYDPSGSISSSIDGWGNSFFKGTCSADLGFITTGGVTLGDTTSDSIVLNGTVRIVPDAQVDYVLTCITGAVANINMTGAIVGNTLTVTVTNGTVLVGMVLTGSGIAPLTKIGSQTSGTTGGLGTYLVNKNQNVSSTAIVGINPNTGTAKWKATAIGTNSIAYEKIQTVTAARLLGARVAGNVVEIALGTGLSFDASSNILNCSVTGSNAILGGGTGVGAEQEWTGYNKFTQPTIFGSTISSSTGTITGNGLASTADITSDGNLTVKGNIISRGLGNQQTNLSVGEYSLLVNSSGTGNSGVGYKALWSNTTGWSNTAVGYKTLQLNTIGSANTAVGNGALFSNVSGMYNTAVGQGALYYHTGNYTTAIGQNALSNNTTGEANTAVGYWALLKNTTGWFNTAVGSGALFANTTGYSNTAVGCSSLTNNTSGSGNTAVGDSVLSKNTIGSYNIGIGNSALNIATAANNISIGWESMVATTTGGSNTAVGFQTMWYNTIGSYNVCLGASALTGNTTGTYNTAIGFGAGSSVTTGSNVSCFGYNAQPTAASSTNEITLGNSSISNLRCQDTSISAVSDRRDKTDIIDIPTGLEFITAVRPRSFVWNMRDGGIVGVQAFGFIAQELLEAQTTVGIVVPKLITTTNPDKYEVAPMALLPIMVKAIQELNAKFEAYVETHP